MLNLVKNDSWLEPYAPVIEHRHDLALKKEKELCGRKGTLSDFANGHLYFGLHRNEKGEWVVREWAPNATDLYLIGDFSEWKELPEYRFKSRPNGVWELKLKADRLHHLDLYKLSMHWNGGQVYDDLFTVGVHQEFQHRVEGDVHIFQCVDLIPDPSWP